MAISVAYKTRGLTSPLFIKAHSTRSMAASKALLSGVSFQKVCDAAGGASLYTIRFFRVHARISSAYVLSFCLSRNDVSPMRLE